MASMSGMTRHITDPDRTVISPSHDDKHTRWKMIANDGHFKLRGKDLLGIGYCYRRRHHFRHRSYALAPAWEPEGDDDAGMGNGTLLRARQCCRIIERTLVFELDGIPGI